ncbi:MAG TPA: hypothetical protein VGB04_07840 [Allosphingosinicella sp.]
MARPQVNTHAHVRTLPDDAAVAAKALTWDVVCNLVLADWNATAP